MAPTTTVESQWSYDMTSTSNSSESAMPTDGSGPALAYIIVVLLFYSTAIVIAIVSYIRKERTDAEEERVYNTYYEYRKELCKHRHRYRVQRTISHLQRTDRAQASFDLTSFASSDDCKDDASTKSDQGAEEATNSLSEKTVGVILI